MKKYLAIAFTILLSSLGYSQTPTGISKIPQKQEKTKGKTISLTPMQVVNLAAEFIKDGRIDDAKVLLNKTPFTEREVEIERLHLIASIYIIENKYDEAIKIYKYILDYQPNISAIRYKLARVYMLKEQWYKADYQLRLAKSDKSLSPEVQRELDMALYYTRQHKNWNFWINAGIAPDNNINNAKGGRQCIATMFGILCNELDDKEKAVGYNISMGGNYEFWLSDNLRIRNEAFVYSSIYDKKDYDDLYLSYTIGPKYLWQSGEIFAGLTANRRWLAHSPYNYSIGPRFNINYDFTKHFSAGLGLSYMSQRYDKYHEILDGSTKGINLRLFYVFDSSKYLIFKTGYDIESTKEEIYSNKRNNYAIGLGMEMPYGFFVYIEPSIQFTKYDTERYFVKDLGFEAIREKDTTSRYAISISNRKISAFGLTPNFTWSYTDKQSNVWQREYKKSAFEITIQQAF